MTKKIHTIQSSDKVEFDKQVNELLELGCELMDGGYEVINNDDGVVYSQVIVFKDTHKVKFYDNGQLKEIWNERIQTSWYENGQKKSEGTYKDGKEDGLQTDWYRNGEKKSEGTYKDGKEDGLWTWWYENGQKELEKIFKDGELISEEQWNEDGSVKK